MPPAWEPDVVAGERSMPPALDRVTRSMLTSEPQPFWEYWDGRLPEATEDDLWGPEAMSILV